jgi:hypothetical protein
MQSARCSSQILFKLEFSQQIFEKYSYTNFHGNPSTGSQVVPCGQTEGQTGTDRLKDANRRFSQFFRMRLKMLEIGLFICLLSPYKHRTCLSDEKWAQHARSMLTDSSVLAVSWIL